MGAYVTLISSLAWPLAVVVVALVFRKELGQSLGRVGQVKYRDIEVTFRDDLRQAEALANSVPALPVGKAKVVMEVEAIVPPELEGQLVVKPVAVVSPVPPRPTGRGREGLARLASSSPRDAVLEAWDEVGQALVRTATKLGDRRGPALTRAEDAIRFLVDRGWIVGPEAQLIERLRMIRERVTLRDELAPSPDDARRFIDLALPTAARVDALA